MTDSDPTETPPPPQLAAMLPALVGVYAFMVGLGWLWLSLRGRTGIVASAAVGSHGPALAAGVGLAAALGLFALGCLLTRYVPTLAELDTKLATMLGPLSDNQIVVAALASGIGEEFFFRCAMQDHLGVWLTALCFGLAHSGGGRSLRWWGPWTAAFGLAMGWLVEAGFGVLSAAVAHALFNYFSLRRLVR